MPEKNLKQRFLIIGIVLLVGAVAIYPPKQKLRPGLDIAGGTSMLFEIEEEPGENNPNLAEDMKRLLQKRVDPRGVYDLVWRAVGRNRLEVQMPLAPPENVELRQKFQEAQEALFHSNVTRGKIESALAEAPGQRAASLARLAAGSAERERLLGVAAAAHDALVAAQQALEQGPAATQAATTSASQPAAPPSPEDQKIAVRDAQESLDDALAAVLETNFDSRRFQDVLELDPTSPRRINAIKELKDTYPSLAARIDTAVQRHAEWREKRAYLEGPADLQRLLRGSGVLEFRILAEPSAENLTKYDRYRERLEKFGPRWQQGDAEQWFKIDNPLAFFNMESPAELARFDPKQAGLWVVEKYHGDWYVLGKHGAEHGLLSPRNGGQPWHLKAAGVGRDQRGRRSVNFQLDALGGSLFRELTRKNINKQLCILVDNVAYSSANIQSEIGTSGEIAGDFSAEKVNYLVQTMQAGSLPARLKDTPVSERTIGSSLGQTNLRLAFFSGMLGLAVVLVGMMVYYLWCGAIANVAVVMNLLLTLAAMALLGARFNLAAIAGVILGIGMSVDSNILIFERMREEKERGSTLRMIIKNGYDKAFATILDSHVTTLLACAIIYYAGSEEIKGFGLTLGWGVVLNLFTAVFVTRTIYAWLVKHNLLKDIKMLKLIGVPNIDWYGLRRIFIPISLAVMVIGLGLLWLRGARDTFDVELLGGVNAEVEVKKAVASQFDDVKVRELLDQVGRQIAQSGEKLREATVTPVEGTPGAFQVSVTGVEPRLLAAMISEPLESGESGRLLDRDGVTLVQGEAAVRVRTRAQQVGDQERFLTAEELKAAIAKLADRSGDSVVAGGDDISRANVGQVLETGTADTGKIFNITTTETNKKLVQYALVEALGDALRTQPRVSFAFRGQGDRPYPITERELSRVVPGLPPGVSADLTDYIDGALFVLDQLDPPQTVAAVRDRLRSMRLQPDFQNLPYRPMEVYGLVSSGQDEAEQPLYTSVAVGVVDAAHPYRESAENWWTAFAMGEQQLIQTALGREQTLRKVTTFKPQVAAQAQTRALVAMGLSWLMIIAYMWIRFGKVRYGVAGVIALVHDVCIALAFVGLSGWIGGANHPIGRFLGIEDFKIDMTVIAAILTLIGYSICDKIVIFDRIREVRGRLGVVSPKVINDSLNQTLSRTLLTGVFVLGVLLIMYIWGGSSIRGFAFCMFIGVVTGTYSSMAIAAPLLLFGMKQETPQTSAGLRPATA